MFMSQKIAYFCLTIIGLRVLLEIVPGLFGRMYDGESFSLLLAANVCAILLAGIHLKKSILTIPFIMWNGLIIFNAVSSLVFYDWKMITPIINPSYGRHYNYRKIGLWPINIRYSSSGRVGMDIFVFLFVFVSIASYFYALRTVFYTYLYLKNEEKKKPPQMENVYTNQVPILEPEDHPKKEKLEEIV